MINYVRGRLVEKNPGYAIVDCNGIGYYINISVNTYSQLGNEENCKLLTHTVVNQQDNSQHLYGFIDEAERSTFRSLISVTGVGASTARMILSGLTPAEVHQAIGSGEVGVFRKVKGIGEKTAQRIILDLSGKLVPLSQNRSESGNKTRSEALKALLTLGFSKNQSEKAIDSTLSANPQLAVDQLVKESMKNL